MSTTMTAGWHEAWPVDLVDGEWVRVTGPGGYGDGITTRVTAGDRFTYRAADDGVQREVHADDGAMIERVVR